MKAALYNGIVTHTRLTPVRHKLRYGVFSIYLDVSDLKPDSRTASLFSLNRFNLLSFHEKDHGDGRPLGDYLKSLAERAGLEATVVRFSMLAYPRVLGYVFNPLTVYYGFDAEGRIALMVYEVRNTFGEKLTYVIPADGELPLTQSCAKAFYVSPFNTVSGDYHFRITAPGKEIGVGVTLKEGSQTILAAAFSGQRAPLTNREILKALGRTGWMTLKVIAGIHWEAGKLWLKGLRMKPRPPAPDLDIVVAGKKRGKRPGRKSEAA